MSEFLDGQERHDLTGFANLNKGLAEYQEQRREAAREAAQTIAEQQAIWDSKLGEREQAARERTRALANARNSARRARERNAVAAWADSDAIKKVYEKAAELSITTGIPHHVDHIVPLAGKLVSGLHVESNLQVIPARINMGKHNKFEVENE